MYEYDRERLAQRLQQLPPWGHLAFGALLLDRAIPNFLQFAAETHAPGGAMLRATQAKIWGLLEGAGAATPFLGITAKLCEVFAPDTELYDSSYTSSALDAVCIACNILDFSDHGEQQLLMDSAELRRDSIDLFLQGTDQVDSDDPDCEIQLMTHPIMQEELQFQDEDLRLLERCRDEGPRAWTKALHRSIDLGYSVLKMRPRSE